MKSSIIVRTQLNDFYHCWPEAPEEVKFLRSLHRHVLHIEVELEVSHDDRDIEFFMYKRWLDKELAHMQTMWPKRISMEQIATDIVLASVDEWKERNMIVKVFEDNEVGGKVVYEPSVG